MTNVCRSLFCNACAFVISARRISASDATIRRHLACAVARRKLNLLLLFLLPLCLSKVGARNAFHILTFAGFEELASFAGILLGRGHKSPKDRWLDYHAIRA